MEKIDLAYVSALYREYAGDLAAVGKQQRDVPLRLEGAYSSRSRKSRIWRRRSSRLQRR